MKENILSTLCLSCMKDAGEKFETCPFCGAAAKVENQFHQLAPGSVLNGRFVVGKTLGQGGFGITYAGYDLTVDTKVAIKEFYPDGGVSRQKDLYTILPYSEKKTEELFTDGKAKFLKEAQKLAKFTDTEGIVQVKDYFEENGTAYIVMEYVEEPTLIQYPSVQQGYPAPPPYKAQQPFSQQLHYSSSWTPNNTPVNSPRPDGNGAPQPNYRQPPQADEAGKKPTVSLVFGILSLVFLILFGCIGGSDLLGIGGGLGFGIAAISVGISAKNKGSYSGKITAGIITGAAGISLTLFIVLLAIGYLYSYHRFKKVRIKRN